MTQVHVSHITSALLRKGFIRSGTDHDMYWFTVNGKKTPIHTYFSRGQRKVDDSLLRLVAKEMRLTMSQLLSFIDCALSGDAYLKILQEKGYLRS